MNLLFGKRPPRDWRNVVALVTVIGFLLIGPNACSSGSQGTENSNQPTEMTSNTPTTPASATPVKTAGESVPTSLANAGEYGENVYDFAKANDWKKASVKLAALRGEVINVRADVRNNSAEVDDLDADVAALDKAVAAKDRQAAMGDANQITLDVANMTSAYKSSIPVEVTKLDYYGRELEVWAQAKDANKLQETARQMRQTWDSLRHSIENHSAVEAKKFDALLARVESAITPADYARVATPVLDEVDNLEKLFQ
jgi:hypothetical protein